MDKPDEITAPNQIILDVALPSDLSPYDTELLAEYFMQNYGMDIDSDPESDNYEEIFYNADLRSRMGMIWGEGSDMSTVRIVFWPRYYLKGETPETYFGKNWLRLMKNSVVVEREE